MRRPNFLYLAILAFIGSCFCLFSLWDTSDIFCLNTGCSIYKGYEIFGISFYWVGAVYFALLGVLALLSRTGFWLRLLTALGLLGNILFLFYQILFWPCSSCLLVAIFFGLFAFFLFRKARPQWRVVFVVWLLFFAGAGFAAIRDSVQPTPLLARENPEITLFFSATCPACKHLLENLVADEALFEKTVLYPVLKSEGDLARIVALKKLLDSGTPPEKAFKAFWEEESPVSLSMGEVLTHGCAFQKNKMVFAKLGEDRVPLILSGRFLEAGKTPVVSAPSTEPESCSFSSEGSGSCTTDGASTPPSREW